MSAAVRALAPVALAAFFDEIYEREPLYVPRNGEESFADVFSLEELENALIVGARDPGRFALVRSDEEELSIDSFTKFVSPPRPRGTTRGADRVLDRRAIEASVNAGYTLVIKDAGSFSAKLARFCAALAADLGCYVQANVYFTPPQAQGLRVHHDTHDTLTLQIEGDKEWTVYDPLVELPLETQVFSGPLAGTAVHAKVHLKAGDSLYVPRGFPHEARGHGTPSLHVTFALVPTRVVDVLEELVNLVAETDVELRRALRSDGASESVAHFIARCTPEAIETACGRAIAANERLGPDANNVFDRR